MYEKKAREKKRAKVLHFFELTKYLLKKNQKNAFL